MHLTHIEDLLIEDKINGLSNASMVLKKLCSGDLEHFSLKWDGSPSFVVGNDCDGRKFVSTKSFFNKSPKYYYTIDQIKDNIADERLARKLINILEFSLRPIGLGKVVQGDLLYHDNYTDHFHPNIIRYEVNDLELLEKTKYSIIGYVIHGYFDFFRDGTITPCEEFPLRENKLAINFSKKLEPFPSIDVPLLSDSVPFSFDYNYTTKEMNSFIRKNKAIPHLDDFHIHYNDIIEVKKKLLEHVFTTNNSISTYLVKDNRKIPCKHEGLVYSDGKISVKLVDRREFSVANFSDLYFRGW